MNTLQLMLWYIPVIHKEKKNIRSGNKILGVRRRNKRPQFSCLSDAEADHLSNKCLPLSVWNIICWCWHVRAALLCPCWLCAAPLPPQAALKKYQMEHKSKGESLEKCQAELKKLRRKSQGSKHPSKYGDKEMQVSVWVCVWGQCKCVQLLQWINKEKSRCLWITSIRMAICRTSFKKMHGSMATNASAKKMWSGWLQASMWRRQPASQLLLKMSVSHNSLHLYFSSVKIRNANRDF